VPWRGGVVIRAFLALEIPDEVKREIELAVDRIRDGLPRSRWVRTSALHVTLKFLGDVEAERLETLTSQLAPLLADLEPVQVELGGTGFFPSPSRARVAWIGGTAPGVRPVVEAVEGVTARAGFKRERRRWSLHLTLARIKRPWPVPATERFSTWGQELALSPFEATEVVLFESELRPTGAVYTALERMPLG
jgi:2'-5' RNA ligase